MILQDERFKESFLHEENKPVINMTLLSLLLNIRRLTWPACIFPRTTPDFYKESCDLIAVILAQPIKFGCNHWLLISETVPKIKIDLMILLSFFFPHDTVHNHLVLICDFDRTTLTVKLEPLSELGEEFLYAIDQLILAREFAKDQ